MKKPILDAQFFAGRRQALLEKMAPNSIAIVATAEPRVRNGDIDYPFRYDSAFYYLTGFREPGSVMVLLSGDKAGDGEYHLFCRPRDPLHELWHGIRAGLEGAKREYLADGSYDIDTLDEVVPSLMASRDVVYTFACDEDMAVEVSCWMQVVQKKVRQGSQLPQQHTPLEHLLYDLRLVKTAEELEVLRYVTEVSAKGHEALMQQCGQLKDEGQLESLFRYHCGMQGCRQMAYPPIVAGGEMACILHYTENNRALRKGDLVLVDAGAEYLGYAADITRTFPVNGQFSGEQKAVYEIVLAAQQAVIELVKPGVLWRELHEKAVVKICEGLLDLGLLSGSVDGCVEEKSYQKFYMHNTGHWLGLDVHDVGSYRVDGDWRELAANMVFTVEPGIYISASEDGIDERWKGIGVRIEDNVCVLAEGCEVLTEGAVKDVEAIESLMRG